MDSSSTVKTPKIVKLKPIEATPASFSEFGQVVSSSPDGQEFGPHDAQLELHRGTPRFYIMHLEDRELKFSKITHHASVTQCLGSIGGEEWYLGVAKASIVQRTEIDDEDGTKRLQSACGHYYIPPHPDDVRVFKITGPKFLKLNVGTWHAGPLFKTRTMDFYNLELSNTNMTSSSSSVGSARRWLRYRPLVCDTCGRKAVIRVSETEKNPGRLFYACLTPSCGWIGWAVPVEREEEHVQIPRAWTPPPPRFVEQHRRVAA